ncbi:hypothetical protein ACLOJK_030647 [Asimina triloba]
MNGPDELMLALTFCRLKTMDFSIGCNRKAMDAPNYMHVDRCWVCRPLGDLAREEFRTFGPDSLLEEGSMGLIFMWLRLLKLRNGLSGSFRKPPVG